MRPNSSKIFSLSLIAAAFFVAASAWLASGTMAPYASTLPRPRILKPCNYLLNTDHYHFEAPFLMLDGQPREQWDRGIYLRRILYPLLALPLMKALGFMAGGVITSIAIQAAGFVAFILYVRRRIGDAGAYAAMALLATYPGIYYWAGLPYCHAMIVPASLLGMVILCELERDGLTVRRAALLSFGMGVLFLAYDLLPLFAPPAVMILLLRRRWTAALVAAPLLVLPTVLNHAALSALYGLPFRNDNTKTYFDIVNAYLHPANLQHWGGLLLNVPGDFVRSYLFSNFIILPALFAVLWIANRFTTRLKLTRAEKWLLVTVALLFAFINLAPPTSGWQFRGSRISRIYQPVFVVMIFFAARLVQAAPARWLTGAIACAALLNAAVVLGPVLRLKLADYVYFAFYRHADGPMLSTNLDAFGRRPLGFCDESITLDNPPPRRRGPKKVTRAQLERLAAQKKLTKAQKERLKRAAPAPTKHRKAAAPATSLPPVSSPRPVTSPSPAPASAPSPRAGASAPSPGG